MLDLKERPTSQATETQLTETQFSERNLEAFPELAISLQQPEFPELASLNTELDPHQLMAHTMPQTCPPTHIPLPRPTYSQYCPPIFPDRPVDKE